jgi:hypothetical protein
MPLAPLMPLLMPFLTRENRGLDFWLEPGPSCLVLRGGSVQAHAPSGTVLVPSFPGGSRTPRTPSRDV